MAPFRAPLTYPWAHRASLQCFKHKENHRDLPAPIPIGTGAPSTLRRLDLCRHREFHAITPLRGKTACSPDSPCPIPWPGYDERLIGMDDWRRRSSRHEDGRRSQGNTRVKRGSPGQQIRPLCCELVACKYGLCGTARYLDFICANPCDQRNARNAAPPRESTTSPRHRLPGDRRQFTVPRKATAHRGRYAPTDWTGAGSSTRLTQATSAWRATAAGAASGSGRRARHRLSLP